MVARKDHPDIMGEALGRIKLPEGRAKSNASDASGGAQASSRSILEEVSKRRAPGARRRSLAQLADPQVGDVTFESRMAQLLDYEVQERKSRKFKHRIQKAALPHEVSVSDLDDAKQRGLLKYLVFSLSSCRWLLDHQNVVITGPAGSGKTFIACALAGQACEKCFTALYTSTDQVLREVQSARSQGKIDKIMKPLLKPTLLILDDFAAGHLSAKQGDFLLGVLDKRQDTKSLLITSRLPVSQWAGQVEDPAIGKAIMDRLASNSYLVSL